jgi:3-hydroxy-3-methylglutaryl CoA synthase
MSEFGILSLGAYVPTLRLQRAAIAEANSWANPGLKARAKGQRAILNWDEDSLTMGLEAARACLAASDIKPQSVTFASTSAPFLDRPASVIVSAALQLSANTRTMDVGSSQRAASSALIQMLMGGGEAVMLVAADARPAKPGSAQELSYGAAGAAALIGSGKPILKFRGFSTNATDFVGHYRTAGEPHEYHWEERWVRDEGIAKLVPTTIKSALANAGVAADDVKHFIFPTTFSGVDTATAKRTGISIDAIANNLDASVGQSGNAHALLMLQGVLSSGRAGDIVVMVTFGHGCDVLVLEVTEHLAGYNPTASIEQIAASGKAETSYQKYLSFTGGVSMDWGIRSEFETKTALSAQYRYTSDAAGFVAGQCAECGTIQFPRAAICVNADCDNVGPQAPVSLRDEAAEILTFTADWLSFKECPPFCFGLVQFANGARALMEFSDFQPEGLAVGAPVRFVYRKKEIDHQRAYHSYFWKAAPAALSGED